MYDFIPIILGTDFNSYSVARCIHEKFNLKSVVCGSKKLIPFYKSQIADFYIEENFSSDDFIFKSVLNKVYEDYKHKTKNFIIFAPTESYIEILFKNLDFLDFDLQIPYADKKLFEKYKLKKNFYKKMEEIEVLVPKTFKATKENYKSIEIDGELFLKADDYDYFNSFDFTGKQKGYHSKNKSDATKILTNIFNSGFDGDILVQQYIPGLDGSEYSVNGYRSEKGTISSSQARNILSDKRGMRIGNYIAQSDSNIEEIFEITKKILVSLNYSGVFNLDFKINPLDGKIYVFEMNMRQGRTFYYSTLGGVYPIFLSIKDLIYGEDIQLIQNKKFNNITQSKEAVINSLNGELKDYFMDEERIKNTKNPIIYESDSNFIRKCYLKRFLTKTDKEILNFSK
ncbi:MAG: carboxylate--amine ligase [Peptoniphilaceae bacterium]|nr:carboxylate--amine ligase [Peptoniphilaceae bacterium]